MDREYSVIFDYIAIVVEEEKNLYHKRPVMCGARARATSS